MDEGVDEKEQLCRYTSEARSRRDEGRSGTEGGIRAGDWQTETGTGGQ